MSKISDIIEYDEIPNMHKIFCFNTDKNAIFEAQEFNTPRLCNSLVNLIAVLVRRFKCEKEIFVFGCDGSEDPNMVRYYSVEKKIEGGEEAPPERRVSITFDTRALNFQWRNIAKSIFLDQGL